jgi:hypothetical protein
MENLTQTSTSKTTSADHPQGQGAGLLNISLNVILPVLILHRLTGLLGALGALGLALSLPLAKGLYDLWKFRRANYFSVLGIINVTMTGSLAVLGLGGLWFAAKEAIFPGLIASFVLASSFGQSPFIKTLLVNPQIMRIDEIHLKLQELNQWEHFNHTLRRATQFLAGSFLFSAICNFILALRIFTPIEQSLEAAARAEALNHQIAQMTMWAMAVTLVPSMLMISAILWYLLKRLQLATSMTTEQILRN